MDQAVSHIAEFAQGLTPADIPETTRHDTRRRIVDTLGAALAAYDCAPVQIARGIASGISSPDGAHVLGTTHRTSPDWATFVNGVMARFLEGNDAYPGGGGHPSDSIMPILAIAETIGASGADVALAVTTAYEIHGHLFNSFRIREKGMDHVYYTTVASAAACARMMRLDDAGMRNAIALAAVPFLPLETTRRGHLSMWKGCASANAARNGAFAAMLARGGMTGPEKPFEGSHGLWELIGPHEVPPLSRTPRLMTERAINKFYLSEFHSQGPTMLALSLREQARPEDIAKLEIYTYWFTWSEIGSGAEKWKPVTHEDADHSLPYIVAASMVRGDFSDELFEQRWIRDPAVAAMLAKVEVYEDKEFSRRVPQDFPCRIVITKTDGTVIEGQLDAPVGHTARPMSDAQIEAKYLKLAGRHLPEDRAKELLDWLWDIEAAPDVSRLFDLAVIGS